MKTHINWWLKCLPAGLLLLFTSTAYAARLEIAPDQPVFLHFAAALLLWAHIGGGTLGIISGVIASLAKKGQKLHRSAGKVFFYSMFICYLIGALVSPFLETEQRTNFVASILSLYLLISGVSAANRRNFKAGIGEKLGLIVALSITAMGITFMLMSANSETGTVDGAPPQAFGLFIIAGALATIGEIKVLLRKTLSPAGRITRHIWRICFSFFIASGSLFFGQAAFFPQWFNASILPLAFGLFPLLILVIGLIKTIRPFNLISKPICVKPRNFKGSL